MTLYKNVSVLLLFFVLASCGYQLRGKVDLPDGFQAIYLQGASLQLKKNFKNALATSEGRLVDDMNQAGVVIHITKEQMQQRVLSLNTTGLANEYELDYDVDFTLFNGQGQVLAEQQSITITKDYYNDQQAILAKNNEQQIIVVEIYRQAVRQMIKRTQLLLKNKVH